MKKQQIRANGAPGADIATEQNAIVKPINNAAKAEPQKTVEQLQKELEELKQKMQAQPQSLEEKIQFFKQKEAFIKQLNKLNTHKENLLTAVQTVGEAVEENEFLSPDWAVRVSHKQGYSTESDIFKLQNPVIVGEVLQFVLTRIDAKIEELKISIEA